MPGYERFSQDCELFFLSQRRVTFDLYDVEIVYRTFDFVTRRHAKLRPAMSSAMATVE